MNTEHLPKSPGRRNPAAGVPLHAGRPNRVLGTVTTQAQVRWLAQAQVQRRLPEVWREATAGWVGDYRLMPDHLHGFCAPHDQAPGIEAWMTCWKRGVRRRHSRADWTFQSRGGHHRLRNSES